MKSLFNKYRAAVHRSYGWPVELNCPQCGFQGMPRYEGWLPELEENASGKPTISAKVACPTCKKRLTDEAGRKLVELFREIPLPERNGRIINEFIAALIIVPLVFAFMLFVGIQMGWLGYSALGILVLSAILIKPLVMLRNYRISMLRSRCACGNPSYLFMGNLDGTQCFRCSSCGRLMRLRE